MKEEKIELFDFEKLSVYQKSLDFVDCVYDLADAFPSKETYSLSSQFKRAAYSISLNIGEGSGGSRREFIQFLTIAKRSLRECVVCTTISYRRKYIDEKTQLHLRKQLTEMAKMLSGFINYLESNKAKNILNEPLAKFTIKKKNTTNYELSTPN